MGVSKVRGKVAEDQGRSSALDAPATAGAPLRRRCKEPEGRTRGSKGARIESIPLDDLKPHPRNYVKHPDDQIAHIARSVQEHGVYKNVVVSRDGYVLAGHGVVEALKRLGHRAVPAHRVGLDHDHPRALKIVVGDNEIGRLREVDDRALTEILRDLAALDPGEGGLEGTGFDEVSLAGLVLVTRHVEETTNLDAAAEWAGVGLPECVEGHNLPKLMILFRSMEDRDRFLAEKGLDLDASGVNPSRGMTLSAWWPPKEPGELPPRAFRVRAEEA